MIPRVASRLDVFRHSPLTLARDTPHTHTQAPLYAIIAFAIYSMAYIIHAVWTFPECPRAAEALARDVARAQRELIARRVLPADAFDATSPPHRA